MTKLESGKPLRRETGTIYRGRVLVVELHPAHLTIREKGRRAALDVDYRTIVDVAWKIKWREEVAAKQAAKKAARRGKK